MFNKQLKAELTLVKLKLERMETSIDTLNELVKGKRYVEYNGLVNRVKELENQTNSTTARMKRLLKYLKLTEVCHSAKDAYLELKPESDDESS